MAGGTEIVAVDLGGTHARFAIAHVAGDGSIELGEPTTLRSKDHVSFQTAWEEYARLSGGTLPDNVALAVAGPITGEVIRFTNNPWIIRPALINEKLGTRRYTIVNDFEAVAYAIAKLPEDFFIHLSGPEEPIAATGTISVIGPGTGLGVAHLWRGEGGDFRVQATEGGHTDYAPVDTIDDAILERLRRLHTRVSAERIVSGPGIVDIYHTLAGLEKRAVEELTDIEIWTLGTSGEDSLASAAVDRFCMALGSVAGDIALVQGGFGGVVIAGGLGYRIRDTLAASGFAGRFQNKGRYQQLMADIPVKIVSHPQPGLLGAATAFAREHLS